MDPTGKAKQDPSVWVWTSQTDTVTWSNTTICPITRSVGRGESQHICQYEHDKCDYYDKCCNPNLWQDIQVWWLLTESGKTWEYCETYMFTLKLWNMKQSSLLVWCMWEQFDVRLIGYLSLDEKVHLPCAYLPKSEHLMTCETHEKSKASVIEAHLLFPKTLWSNTCLLIRKIHTVKTHSQAMTFSGAITVSLLCRYLQIEKDLFLSLRCFLAKLFIWSNLNNI